MYFSEKVRRLVASFLKMNSVLVRAGLTKNKNNIVYALRNLVYE